MTDILIDGLLTDWQQSLRIDDGSQPGYEIYGTSDATDFIFAIKAPTTIGANTTAWFNTDRNAATGFQIFTWAGGAEYNVNFDANGVPALYTGDAGQTLVAANLTYAYNADHTAVEFRVSKAAVGNPMAMDTLYDINNSTYIPSSYSNQPFTVYNDMGIVPSADTRIGIVYSQTTANNYFGATAYSDLFMAVQSQAMQAGVAFDILTESDLTNLATLAKYDALVFPSFRNVQASDASLIAHTLQQAQQQFHLGIIAGGEFMTDDQANNALPGNSYANMVTLLGATRTTGGNGVPGTTVTITATDPTGQVLDGYASGEVVHQYTGIGWNAFAATNGTGVQFATETINGVDYAAALATQTGGRNVLFSTEGVMADANMLQDAIKYVVNGSGVGVELHMTRSTGILASRVDMDQSQELVEVNPPDGSAGIYDKLVPIVAQWKADYNFVGSYYVNIGDGTQGTGTDWAVSLPYYTSLIKLGNEIGTHSYTHPDNTNLLSDSQLQYQFQQSADILSQQLSQALGYTYTIAGAAVPGAAETVDTSLAIIPYLNTYLSGGWTGIGSGYPNAFGFLTPGSADMVYLAPNTVFDFTLVEFQHMTPAQASAVWAAEWSAVTSHADMPIVVWPFHDYAAAAWDTTGTGAPSPYTTQMFTDYIARAASDGMEFVTLADLAARIWAYKNATVTTSISGNVITANVSAYDNIGTFALDLTHEGSQVIQNVAGWYAYDSDSVFLPQNGGTFTVTLGSAQDDVTHITSLGMRASLLSLTGDGTSLAFTLSGEGLVVIDLTNPGGRTVDVTGASVVSQVGEILTLNVGAIGLHDVHVIVSAVNYPPVITSDGGGDTAAIAIAENTVAVTTVVATDPEGVTPTYALSGTDSALFNLNATTGALTFKVAPNFEAPADAGANNIYDVIVTASDGIHTDAQALAITVTNVNEAPIITSNGGGASAALTFAENGTGAVTTVVATDPERAAIGYSLSGVDASQFTIDPVTGMLKFVAAPDYEAPTDTGANNVYNVNVIASDGVLTDSQALAITVSNVAGIRVTLRSAGTLVGTIEQDTLTGSSGADVLSGLGGSDTLSGAAGNDTLIGGTGNDLLIGGTGIDLMTGGAGADTFQFDTITDSRVGPLLHDIITDFQAGLDLIDLSGIDANTGRGGNQSFTFLSAAGASFTAAGQVAYHYETIGGSEYTIVQANVNGQLTADFEVALLGHVNLTSNMFVL